MRKIYISCVDRELIKGFLPESMAELVNRKMSIEDADKIRQYLAGKVTGDRIDNILLYGSILAKKVNFYNHLIGGEKR